MAGRARPNARGTLDYVALQQKQAREQAANLARRGLTPTHPIYLPDFPPNAVEGQIAFARPDVMGQVLSAAALSNGLRVFCGVLYQPDGPLKSGELVGVDFSHWPGDNFAWLAMRVHSIQGLTAVEYDRTQPWLSDPFNGSIGSYGPGIPSRLWNKFTSFLALTNTSGDVVTWTHPFAAAEQFAWDLAATGHIGYAFHDFAASPVTDVASATFGSSSTEKVGAVQFNDSTGAVTVGATLGSGTTTGSKRLSVTLSADQPAGYAAMIVGAAKTTETGGVSDSRNRPLVLLDRGNHPVTTKVPYQYLDGQWIRISNGPYI